VLVKIALNELSWSIFHRYRKEIRKQFPNIYRLKTKRVLFKIITKALNWNDSILDVGASNKNLGKKIKEELHSITYKTMDIDKANEHDYYSLDGINELFDLIIMAEVIEHIKFNEGIELLYRLKRLLKQGGKIIITTPNIHHPHRFWDPDHITPYRYDDLGGALLYVGFNIEGIYRIYNASILKYISRIVLLPLFKLLDIDFARSIAIVACNAEHKG
jgi:SAM-dependent methyltransferase